MKRSPRAAARKMDTLRLTFSLLRSAYSPQARKGPAMAMEKVLAPRVVSPPWASRMAWKRRTMTPRMLTQEGPKRMAPSPVPVMWEQLPVTEGIFREEITKIKAPDMASSMSAFRFSCTVLRIEKKPASTKGRHKTPQAMQKPPGR